MVFAHLSPCLKCNEPITDIYRAVHDRPITVVGVKSYHVECADFNTDLDTEYRARFNTYHIEKLTAENTKLNQKVNTLLKELEKLVKTSGGTDEEIEDIRAEFNVYDEAKGS